MTHAGGGGCCDCGDPSSWDPRGACDLHRGGGGSESAQPAKLPPAVEARVHPVVEFITEVICCSLTGVPAQGTAGTPKGGHFMCCFDACVNTAMWSGPDQDQHVVLIHDASDISFKDVITTLVERVLMSRTTSSSQSARQRARRDAHQIANVAHWCGRAVVWAGSRTDALRVTQSISGPGIFDPSMPVLESTLSRLSPSDVVVPLSRLAELIRWVSGICELSSTFRDWQCTRMLRRYTSNSITNPGIRGVTKGDWVKVVEEDDDPRNYTVGLVCRSIMRDSKSMLVDVGLPHAGASDEECLTEIPTRQLVALLDPPIRLSRGRLAPAVYAQNPPTHTGPSLPRLPPLTLQAVWRDLVPENKRDQLCLLSDGLHLIMAYFVNCNPPRRPGVIKVTQYRVVRTADFGPRLTVHAFEKVECKYQGVIGRPRPIECAGGELAAGKPPHRLSILFRYNFAFPLTLWPDLSSWFFRLFGNATFKQSFAAGFASHYSQMMFDRGSLGGSRHESFMSYGVQVFTIPSMTPKVVKQDGLLRTMIATLNFLVIDTIRDIRQNQGDSYTIQELKDAPNLAPEFETYPRPLFETSTTGFKAMEQLHPTMSNGIRDIEYVLRNPAVPEHIFLQDPSALRQWLQFLILFENMDVHCKQTGSHVQFEKDTWKVGFRTTFLADGVSSLLLKSLSSIAAANRLTERNASEIIRICRSVYESLGVYDGLAARSMGAEFGLGSGLKAHSVKSHWSRFPREVFKETNVLLPDCTALRVQDLEDTNIDIAHCPADVLSMHCPALRFIARTIAIVMRKYPLGSVPMRTLFHGLYERKDQRDVMRRALEPIAHVVAGVAHVDARLWVLNGFCMNNQSLNYSLQTLSLSGMRSCDLVAFQTGVCSMGSDAALALLAHHFRLFAFFDLSPLVRAYPSDDSSGDSPAADTPTTKPTTAAQMSAAGSSPGPTSGPTPGPTSGSTSAPMDLDDLKESKSMGRRERVLRVLRQQKKRQAVERWGEKLADVTTDFLLFISRVLTERRAVARVDPAVVIRRKIVHCLVVKPSRHSHVLDAVDKDLREEHKEAFQRELRRVADLIQLDARASSQWKVKRSAVERIFNPFFIDYQPQVREEAEQQYKSMFKQSASPGGASASPSKPRMYPPVVTYEPLLPSFQGLYDLYGSSILWRIIFQTLRSFNRSPSNASDLDAVDTASASRTRAGSRGSNSPSSASLDQKSAPSGDPAVPVGTAQLPIVLKILSVALSDMIAGHLDQGKVRSDFFLNLTNPRETKPSSTVSGPEPQPRTQLVSVLTILCDLRDGKGSPVARENSELIAWIVRQSVALDASGRARTQAGVDLSSDGASTGAKQKKKKKKLSKRERMLAKAKARRKKIIKNLASQRSRFEAENKEAIAKDKAKQKSEEQGTGGFTGLTCIVCRTDNASSPLGLIACLQKSSMASLAFSHQCGSKNPRKEPKRTGDGPRIGALARFCGHAMHFECRDSFIASVEAKRFNGETYPGMGMVDRARGEFVCPLCDSPANELVPIPPKSISLSNDGDNPMSERSIGGGIDVSEYGAMALSRRITEYISQNVPRPPLHRADKFLLNSVAYTIRSMEMAYRLRESNAAKPRYLVVAEALKAREIMGLGSLIASLASVIQTRLATRQPKIEMQHMGAAVKAFALGRTREGSVHNFKTLLSNAKSARLLSLGTDAFRLLVYAAADALVLQSQVSSAAQTDAQRAAVKGVFDDMFVGQLTTLLEVRMTQALTHAVADRRRLAQKDTHRPSVVTLPEDFRSRGPGAILASMNKLPSTGTLAYDDSYFNQLVLPFMRQAAILLRACRVVCGTSFERDAKAQMVGGGPSAPRRGAEGLENKEYLEEKKALSDYLSLTTTTRIPEGPGRTEDSDPIIVPTEPMDVPIGDRVENWLKAIATRAQDDDGMRRILNPNVPFLRDMRSPALAKMPKTYNDVFMAASEGAAPGLNWASAEATDGKRRKQNNPAVCLLTGRILDIPSPRQRNLPWQSQRTRESLSQHTARNSPNAGVFLCLLDSKIVLINSGWGAVYGSPYVDENGEMDIGIYRGNMLYLDQNRLDALRELIVQQGICDTVARLRSMLSQRSRSLSDRNAY